MRFFAYRGASIQCRLVHEPDNRELQIFGNRAGLASLANVLLWFVANAWRREFLSFGELEFVQSAGNLVVCLRLAEDIPLASHGILRRQDRGESIEWAIAEEGLQQVALGMHSLASRPTHEYDRLLAADGSEYGVHVRMTDAAEWIRAGIA